MATYVIADIEVLDSAGYEEYESRYRPPRGTRGPLPGSRRSNRGARGRLVTQALSFSSSRTWLTSKPGGLRPSTWTSGDTRGTTRSHLTVTQGLQA